MVSLGRGFYEFWFATIEDLHLVRAQGTANLKSGVLHLSQWTRDFDPYTQRRTHAEIWIGLMGLPQDYWSEKTLMEIAGAIGTPLLIYAPTRNHAFGHYVKVLADMDLSKRIFDEILVVRVRYAFRLEVIYE